MNPQEQREEGERLNAAKYGVRAAMEDIFGGNICVSYTQLTADLHHKLGAQNVGSTNFHLAINALFKRGVLKVVEREGITYYASPTFTEPGVA